MVALALVWTHQVVSRVVEWFEPMEEDEESGRATNESREKEDDHILLVHGVFGSGEQAGARFQGRAHVSPSQLKKDTGLC